MEPLAAGDPVRVSDFEIRGRLGAGGMGTVFLGRSPGGRAVAVKVVHTHLAQQAEFRRRFQREVTAALAVGGAFTAPVVAAGPEDDPPWIATAYVPGPSLAQAVARSGPLPEASMWPLAAGLAEALRAIHANDLLHRDLKPSNVLLAADGPRVIDFGIARTMDATALTSTGVVIGTPGFMSPEQAEGDQLGPASDIFSLGAVLAFAATGVEPFGEGPPVAVLHRVVASEPRLVGLQGPVRPLITACLAKNPADRPTTAQLLDQITSCWDPPVDFPDASPWPQAVTVLVNAYTSSATARYTEHATTSPPTPSTATTADREDLARRHSRACELGGAGEHAESARLHAELAVDRVRLLGPDHYDSLLSRHLHAYELGQAGEHSEAARLLAEVAADWVRVVGPDHPDALNARHSRACELGGAGEHAESARLHAELAVDRVRLLGPDHYDSLLSRHLHAYELGQAGEHSEAARLLAEVAADWVRVVGPDHPDTLNARSFSDRWSE
ncbi:serine/threonine-protein kinase [Streptomyces rochei]|uniref:serine/threonine-protein kinase n=2 Tax=Streptomyces rochei TaxID=1928 RepID=UPI0033C3057C